MGAGFTFGKIGSTSLDLRLSALEASGQGKVISTPRISTLNGGQAKISQGTKIPYQSSGPDGPKTEFVDANLELSVTPVINPDNSMILDISATNSSVGSTVSTGTGAMRPPSIPARPRPSSWFAMARRLSSVVSLSKPIPAARAVSLG